MNSKKRGQVRINMDKSEYQRLAKEILVYRDLGFSWAESQREALQFMRLFYGWSPS